MIVGIDPSLTGLAVVKGRDLKNWQLERWASKPLGDTVRHRIIRYENLVHDVMRWIGGGPFDAVFIEGYSMHSKGQAITGLAEFGGILRWHLDGITEAIYEVSPSTLKQFATGSGNSKKEVVGAHLALQYAVKFKSDDAYDAFGLFALGNVALGRAKPGERYQATAAAKAIEPPKPKKKSSKP